MRARIAIVYNKPSPSRYDTAGESKAVAGVLDAVEAVHQALVELDYEVVRVPLLPPVEAAEKQLETVKADLLFNLFEGFCGYPETEALLPEFASKLGIPYTGCPAAALTQALDKAKTKLALEAAEIRTPAFQVLCPDNLDTFRLSYPCIVKPCAEDASHGLSEDSVVSDFASLAKQVISVSGSYGGQALVEEYVDGREFNATVLGNSECTALPVSEIVYCLPVEMPQILTFAAKWDRDSIYFSGTRAVCPASISAWEREYIAETALAAFKLLGCRGYARVDMRMDRSGRLNVIEVNPNPDISPDSGAARQAQAAGMTYHQFIEKIVLLALEKKATVKVRPMAREDKPRVMKILRATPEFKPFEVLVAEELIDCYLSDCDQPDYKIMVAEVDSLVMGYVCYGPTPLTEGTWDVYWIAVDRERQGRGIGGALMMFVEREIRVAQGRLALLETSSTSQYEKARRFYFSHGYEVISRIPDFYSPGDDKLTFQKRLK